MYIILFIINNCIVIFFYVLFIDDYNIAQEKANIAKTTSDLLNNESYDNSIQNSIKLKQKRKLCQPEVPKKSLWSPASSDIFGKII
jgi:hypothetical protein